MQLFTSWFALLIVVLMGLLGFLQIELREEEDIPNDRRQEGAHNTDHIPLVYYCFVPLLDSGHHQPVTLEVLFQLTQLGSKM